MIVAASGGTDVTMARCTLYLLLFATACGAPASDPLCPDGWDAESTGLCFPPAASYDDFPGSEGIFGYVKQRSCTAHCDDIVQELPAQRVVVFDDTLPSECEPDDEFGWRSDPTADPICRAHVVAEAESDDEGVFTIVLPPGDYLVVTDTVVFDGWDGRRVTVSAGTPRFVELYFDAVPV
jgi:hypothetical protein